MHSIIIRLLVIWSTVSSHCYLMFYSYNYINSYNIILRWMPRCWCLMLVWEIGVKSHIYKQLSIDWRWKKKTWFLQSSFLLSIYFNQKIPKLCNLMTIIRLFIKVKDVFYFFSQIKKRLPAPWIGNKCTCAGHLNGLKLRVKWKRETYTIKSSS